MSVPKVLKSSGKQGNSIPVSPARKWCFTWNNYESDAIKFLENLLENHEYIIGEEVGEQGTPHLQGYVRFKNKVRPLSIIKSDKIHWTKCKGTHEQNIIYCGKGGIVHSNMNINKSKPKVIVDELYGWQIKKRDKLLRPPIPREIDWVWSSEGQLGKSTFCKYMCVHHDALVLCGTATNIKNGIMKWMLTNPNKEPKIIILDYPRSSAEDFISYAGLEEIKNDCFFSPKFEGGMCIYNVPHVVVLANTPPDLEQMSEDRWTIEDLYWIVSRFD